VSRKNTMNDADITKNHHVDFQTTSYLAIYAKFTVIVYGE
jgi:hypothetical protein